MVHAFLNNWMGMSRGLHVWNKELMPEDEYMEHVAKVRTVMEKEDLEVLLLASKVAYFRSRAITIIPRSGPLCVVEPRASAPDGERSTEWLSRRYLWVRDIIQPSLSDSDLVSREIRGILADIGYQIKIGYVGLTADLLNSLKKSLPESEFVEAARTMNEVLAIKSNRELNLINKSSQLADVACAALTRNIKKGVKECEIIAEMDHAVKLGGAADFKVALSTGKDAEKCLRPGAWALYKQLTPGDVVIFNGCIQYHDYWAEIGRTFVVGKADKAQTALYTAALEAHREGLQAVKAGTTVSDIAMAITQKLKDDGYEKYLQKEYGFGHSIGLAYEEPPKIIEGETGELKNGMVICVKLGLHAFGIGGAFLADTVLVTEKSAKTLTKAPYNISQ